MAVQLQSDSSSVLFYAQQAARAATRRVTPDTAAQARAATELSGDSARIQSQTQAAGVHEAVATLGAAQRGMEVLNVAGESLNRASQQISELNKVVASGKVDASARLAVADGLAALDRTLGTKYNGTPVLGGADFSVPAQGKVAEVKVQIGDDTLRNLPSLLASGGRGFKALDLEQQTASQLSLAKASTLVGDALSQVTSQAGTMQALFARLDGQMGALTGASGLKAEAAPGAAKATVAAIGDAAAEAAKAQARVSAEAAQRLLVD